MTRRSRANPNRQHPQRDRIGEVGAAASLLACVVLALAVGTWAVVSWRAGWWPFETDDAADAATVAATPQVVTVDEGSLTETVSAESTVAAADTDSLSFEASGTVSEVLVKEGDTVTAGQVMARTGFSVIAGRCGRCASDRDRVAGADRRRRDELWEYREDNEDDPDDVRRR